MGKPLTPIAVGMSVESFDFALLLQDAKPIEGDDLFVRKAQIGIRCEALDRDPRLAAIMLASRQIYRHELRLPVHDRVSKG